MSTQPNVLFFMVDQMRGDAFGADGNDVMLTPNLDALASRGTRFNHAYTPSPSCIPARACLWSGMDPWHAGILGMGWGQSKMPNDYPHTLPGEFARAGYRTHLIGKGHFHPYRALMGFESTELDESGRTDESLQQSDYRTWFYERAPDGVTPDDHGIGWNGWQARPWHTEEYLHPTAWTATRGIEFLAQRDHDRPFFLNLSFARPHSPYVPPRPYWEMYMDQDLPAPAVGEWAVMHDDPQTALRPDAWRGRMSPRQIHRARAGYYGEISFIDAQIGRIMNWLCINDRDAYNNTWIVFTSDHGDMQGDHNLWRKTYAYEGSARIPLLIVPPPGSEGQPLPRPVAEEVATLQDLMPTLLDVAGLQTPPTVTGQSLRPLLDAPAETWRPYMHGEHCSCYARENEVQYLTDGKRKFVWLPRWNIQQFFDLQADPTELHNLIDEPDRAEEVALWRGWLIEELRARECGWCTDGTLSHTPDAPMVSPWRDRRWTGTS